MRILLIQSYLGRKEKPLLPLGLAYIAGSLNGHEISIVDPNIENDPLGSIRKKLISFKPEVIGISLRNIDTTLYKDMFYYYKALFPTIELIKEIAPHSIIIIGGAAFSLYAEEIMHQNPKIDFGIYLDGEETFSELLNNLSNPAKVRGIYYRQNSKLLFSGMRASFDFVNALNPRWDLFNMSAYLHPEGIGVQSKRGCCLNCAYCTYPFLSGRSLRLRPPEKVVEEIELLVNKYRITHFVFSDTVFNLPQWHAVKICEEIIRRKIAVKWTAYFSLKKIDDDFIVLAQRAGCYSFSFSPDGYSNKTLEVLRKEVCKRDIKNVYKAVKKLQGANFDFSFFINPPGQNYWSFIALIWLFLKTNILSSKKHMHVSLNLPRLEPHTALCEIAIKEGTIGSEQDLLPLDGDDIYSAFYHNPNIKLVERLFDFLLRLKKIRSKNKK